MYLTSYLTRPVQLLKSYRQEDLWPDLLAGISVGVILLPQAIAFTLIAQLPLEMGFYAACAAAIAGALWGSSNHVQTGPANTTSLLFASVLVALAQPNTARYVLAAGLLAVLVGMFQLFLGAARLGMLVNFVSYSVIVGFSAGSGILIVLGQLRPLLGMGAGSSSNVLSGLFQTTVQLPQADLVSAIIGVGTILLVLLLTRTNPKLPAALISLVVASAAVALLGEAGEGVRLIGDLPRGLPPLADLPLLDLNMVASLSTGTLAVGAMGLIQTAAVSRSLSAITRQKTDNNQEFVGQGMANIASGLLTGYPVSASFSRSGFNLQAGARTPLAAAFSGVFLLVILLTLAPLAALMPVPAVSGVLILTAINLIDRVEIASMWRESREDALIMVVTLFATLFLRLDFAVLTGILLSFAVYIKNTSTPRVHPVVPDDQFRHLTYQPEKPLCPQLAIFDILGDLYFGAVSHIEASLRNHMAKYPGQRFLLLRMQNVDNCDISGIHMLESIVEAYRQRGGDVFMVRTRQPVYRFMQRTGFHTFLGEDHFLHQDDAIEHLFYKVLEPAICIYESEVRVFRECQTLARPEYIETIPKLDVPQVDVSGVEPRQLWEQLRQSNPPVVIDVREPREYRRGHIPQARLVPLLKLFAELESLPKDQAILVVCRSGRRSRYAARMLISRGYQNVRILNGGIQAWENAGLLEAVEHEPS